MAEGVRIKYLVAPVKITREEGHLAVTCVKMKLGEPDASGRSRPVPLAGSEFEGEFDALITAIGQATQTPGAFNVRIGKGSTINVDPVTLTTNRPGVFAGGDAVTGPATVVEAVAAGKKAASAIHAYLRGQPMPRKTKPRPRALVEPIRMDYQEKAFIQRQEISMADLNRRMTSFDQVESVLDETACRFEAKRCMRCDVCERCGRCVEVCAEKLGQSGIEFYHAGESSLILKDYVHGLPFCIGCGTCANICPTGALQVEDVAGERRILMCGTVINRLKMISCERCGTDFVPRAAAKHTEKELGKAGVSHKVRLCPDCLRVERASRFSPH
ncbi:MAG: FAD-dependent oxidoreductase [Pseudomonadota bacterium]